MPDSSSNPGPPRHCTFLKVSGHLSHHGDRPAGNNSPLFWDDSPSSPRPGSLPLWNPELKRGKNFLLPSSLVARAALKMPLTQPRGEVPCFILSTPPHIQRSAWFLNKCRGIMFALVWSFLEPGVVSLSLHILQFHERIMVYFSFPVVTIAVCKTLNFFVSILHLFL